MSEDQRDSQPDSSEEARMLELLSAALTEDGDLLPTDESEVARVEERLEREPVTLPEELAALSFEGGAEVVDLDARRAKSAAARSVATHAVALAVGIAATFALRIGISPSDSPAPALSNDPAGVAPSASAPPKRISLRHACEDCCGGASCARATALKKCSSGRTCVACDPAVVADSRYRVRVSAVTPAPLGRDVLRRYPNGEPELCIRAGVSTEHCEDTRITDREGGRWLTFAPVFSGADLASKVTVRLRWKGVQGSLATAGTWTMPVALTPKSLCSGYSVELMNEHKEELFGSLSFFVDDAHYVELGRAASTGPLRDLRGRVDAIGVSFFLQETAAADDERFALTVGPMNRRDAEKLRWQLLEQDLGAKSTVGADHRGEPLSLP